MTALRALGPEPMAFAYVQPSRRPDRWSLWRKPKPFTTLLSIPSGNQTSPDNIQELYLGSLEMLGFDPTQNAFVS